MCFTGFWQKLVKGVTARNAARPKKLKHLASKKSFLLFSGVKNKKGKIPERS